jgi:signal transduction histidine kinase
MDRWREDHAALRHDLRNSINIVLGFCGVLQRTEPLTPNQARYLDRIKRATETMAGRVAQDRDAELASWRAATSGRK